MSYIVRSGNLTGAPSLRTNPETNRSYCFARVAVNDRARDDTGQWQTVGTTFYDLTVTGNEAERLVALAEDSGNVRVVFAGRYRVREYARTDGTKGLSHNVRADEVGVSLRGQDVSVSPSPTQHQPPPPEAEDEDWRQFAGY